MSVILSNNQDRLVETQSKKTSQLPSYFSAGFGDNVQISRDFERFLILKSVDQKSKALNWLTQAKEFGVINSDRDALISSLIKNDRKDAILIGIEVNPFIDQFSRFRLGYVTSEFVGVSEVGLMLADMQRPMGELNEISRRSFQRQVVANVAFARLRLSGLTSNNLKQLNSWFTPLTAY